MNIIALFTFEDLSGLRFMEECLQKNGGKMDLSQLCDEYYARFGHSPRISVHTMEEWNESNLDWTFYPLQVVGSTVARLGHLPVAN